MYSIRPSEILFPGTANPNIRLAIDNIVFEIGYKEELELELEIRKADIGRQDGIMKALFG